MRKASLCLVAVALAALCAPVPAGDKDAGAAELKKIQGTWLFTAHEYMGKADPPESLEKLRITFRGDKWTVTQDGKVVQAGTHKVDPSKKPGQVDAMVTEGEGKGETMLGIYELKDDTLRVSFMKGKDRPTDFTGKMGMNATLKRETKEKK